MSTFTKLIITAIALCSFTGCMRFAQWQLQRLEDATTVQCQQQDWPIEKDKAMQDFCRAWLAEKVH